METITCCPGVVAVERYRRFAYVRWEPAATWLSSSYRLDDWKGHVHLVAKASLLPSIRASLYLRLPEDVIRPDRRLDLAMARAFWGEALPPMDLVVAPPRLRAELPAIPGDLGPAPTHEWLLRVDATHRYTCYPAPGAGA